MESVIKLRELKETFSSLSEHEIRAKIDSIIHDVENIIVEYNEILLTLEKS